MKSDSSLPHSQQPVTRRTRSTSSPSFSFTTRHLLFKISVPVSAFSCTLEICERCSPHHKIGDMSPSIPLLAPSNSKTPFHINTTPVHSLLVQHVTNSCFPTQLPFQPSCSYSVTLSLYLPTTTNNATTTAVSWNLILQDIPKTFQHIPLVEVMRQ
jgi:hypothetical protein